MSTRSSTSSPRSHRQVGEWLKITFLVCTGLGAFVAGFYRFGFGQSAPAPLPPVTPLVQPDPMAAQPMIISDNDVRMRVVKIEQHLSDLEKHVGSIERDTREIRDALARGTHRGGGD